MSKNGLPTQLTRKQERVLLKVAAAATRAGHPNQSREGCPEPEILEAVARRSLTGSALGEAVDHIANCSPCFGQYERIRLSDKVRRTAGLVVALTALGLLVFFGTRNREVKPETVFNPPPLTEPTREVPSVKVALDLRRDGIARGGPDRPVPPGKKLPRARMEVQILLPLGSAEGRYNVTLYLGSRAVLGGPGEATYQNQAEVLKLSLDTTSISPGSYRMRLAPAVGAPMAFPIVIE